jgi:hypothetical protein
MKNNGHGECIFCNFLSNELDSEMKCKDCQIPKVKKLSLYVAMNKDEFDVENMSYIKTKRNAEKRWGGRQIIRKATLIIEL